MRLICSVRLICLVVEVREVGQDVSTGGTAETLRVPALLTSGQSGPLSLVEILRGFALIGLLHQLSYAINTQLTGG